MTASLRQLLPDLQSALSEGFDEIEKAEQRQEPSAALSLKDRAAVFSPSFTPANDTSLFFYHNHARQNQHTQKTVSDGSDTQDGKRHFWQNLPFLGKTLSKPAPILRQEPRLGSHFDEADFADTAHHTHNYDSSTQNILDGAAPLDSYSGLDVLDPGQISHEHGAYEADAFSVARRAKSERVLASERAAAISSLMTLSNMDDEGEVAETSALTFGAILLRLTALVVVLAGLIGLRDKIVHYVPSLAPLYQVVGLTIAPQGFRLNTIASSLEREQNQTVLIVEGDVQNIRGVDNTVPPIRIDVRDNTGRSIYYWTLMPQKRKLGAYEQEHFKSRLASPPQEGVDVAVSFAQH